MHRWTTVRDWSLKVRQKIITILLPLNYLDTNERELCFNLYLFCCQFTKLTAATSKSCYIVIIAASELSEIEHWL